MNRYTFQTYCKDHKITLIILLMLFFIQFIMFSIYDINLEPLIYSIFIFGSIIIAISIIDFIRTKKKHQYLLSVLNQQHKELNSKVSNNNTIETDYLNIIYRLLDEHRKIRIDSNNVQSSMIDYYTTWAHQIKTPIAALKLLLDQDGISSNKDIKNQLFYIEQYVNMVLGFLRIENPSSDLVIKKFSLDDLIKQSIRKYAPIFINKSISIDFEETNTYITTDEKWFVFILEQILSNAVKYTSVGSVSIELNDKELLIKDTGIGISKEDLPRIFDHGFTGYNGHSYKSATGIGLYLSKRILNKLEITINITSTENVGTTVHLNLDGKLTKM